MALTDIHFQEGENQDFIVEIGAGTLGAPLDILVESDSAQYLVMELQSSGGNIFIMSE